MKVAVIQPHYLPWMGYFAMMDAVDVFVFYDDVQFSHQSWQQRNKIRLADGRVQWLTVPIHRDFGQRICDVKIQFGREWQDKHWETIKQSYSKAPYFNLYEPYIHEIYEVGWYNLSDLTIYMTRMLAEMLNIKVPRLYKSSDMGLEGKATDRLIMLLKKLGATEYVSGLAALDYIEEDKFTDIKLSWFVYVPAMYPQMHSEFISHLSAIDLLFNTGEDAIRYVRQR